MSASKLVLMLHLEIKQPELVINVPFNAGNALVVTLIQTAQIVIKVSLNYKMDAIRHVLLDFTVKKLTGLAKVSFKYNFKN